MNKRFPNHIAFIMDGNRRWAKDRGLPVLEGHRRGAGRIEPLVELAAKTGIRFVTFWAFSSENWKRGEKEVGFLMRIFRDFIKSSVVKRMMEKDVRVKVIGDFESFPSDIVSDVKEIIRMSKNNGRITATFALNYGGRQEIICALNNMIKDSANMADRQKFRQYGGQAKIKNNYKKSFITYDIFSSYLYTKDLPDPDMIVRTGGEKRLSGFLPWQSIYSELYFTDLYWPDFDKIEFEKAIEEYASRERRFGK